MVLEQDAGTRTLGLPEKTLAVTMSVSVTIPVNCPPAGPDLNRAPPHFFRKSKAFKAGTADFRGWEDHQGQLSGLFDATPARNV